MSKANDIQTEIDKLEKNSFVPAQLKEARIKKLKAELDALGNNDGEKKTSTKKKQGGKKVSITELHQYKGTKLKELSEENCKELLQQVAERRKLQAKAEKKSKSKPVVEKIITHVATAATQAIKNISVADIKDNPKKEINKMKEVANAVKVFMETVKTILGEDYDKEAVDDSVKEIRDLIKALELKYKD